MPNTKKDKVFNYKMAIESFTNAGIEYLINVPATGMTPVYEFYEKNGRCIFASREEEAIAIASGIAIGGKLPLVFVQQSGVGNMLNAFIGIADGYDIYFPVLVLDRGIEDENPIQAYSSYRTIPIINTFEPPLAVDFSTEEAIEEFDIAIKAKKRWFISRY